MASIFSKIVSGEIPSFKIMEDENYLAFLDITPIATGHVLVIPKLEVDYIFNMEDELYKGLFLFAKKVAPAIERAIPCKKIGVAIIGLEVPHAHIHLVPLQTVGDINFEKPKMKVDQAELKAPADKIVAQLAR